jgi:sterol desaturase/sphingolipid hydroxylase (fatty acid hydroxylase superfamily)
MEQTIATLLQWKVLAVGLWLAGFFLLERLLPAAPAPERRLRGGRWQRVFVNGGLWSLNIGLSLAIVVPLSAWAAAHGLTWRPAWWSGLQGLLLDLLLLDFLIYWWHRANHEIRFLWRFHEVHHLDRFLDTTSAVRFHWGEVLLSAGFRAAVILLFDIPIASVLVFETVVLFAAIFHHSNVKLPRGLEWALSRVIITPSIHWVHHHAVRRDTDSNYGTLFSFWDRLFASKSPNPRAPDMPIGVQGRDEESFASLLVHPFKPQDGAQPRRSTAA